MNFKIIDSQIIYKGRVFDLKVDKIEYNSGNPGVREIAMHNGGAVVVAETNEGKILLIKQYRYPLDTVLIELPAGKLEKDEDPYICAGRELEEETGFKAGRIEKLGEICTTPGFCDEILHIYYATDLRVGQLGREEGEFGMEVFEYNTDELPEMILSGQIKDAKTICGLNYYFLKKEII